MTSEPKPLAAQSFEMWVICYEEKLGYMINMDERDIARAAWSHQQAKIDELEKKLALARNALEKLAYLECNGVARAMLNAIDGETTSYPACQTTAKPPTPKAP